MDFGVSRFGSLTTLSAAGSDDGPSEGKYDAGGRAQSQKVFFVVELTGFHEIVSRHDTRPIQTTESRPPRGLA